MASRSATYELLYFSISLRFACSRTNTTISVLLPRKSRVLTTVAKSFRLLISGLLINLFSIVHVAECKRFMRATHTLRFVESHWKVGVNDGDSRWRSRFVHLRGIRQISTTAAHHRMLVLK